MAAASFESVPRASNALELRLWKDIFGLKVPPTDQDFHIFESARS